MSPFSNHRAKRNTIFVALLVSAFALVSGMANACLLETSAKHSHVTASRSADAPHARADDALASAAVAVSDHDDGWDGSKESCLKNCGDGANAPVKLSMGGDPAAPGRAPLVLLAWNPATPVVSASNRFDALQVRVKGPPFRVRYSRLTL